MDSSWGSLIVFSFWRPWAITSLQACPVDSGWLHATPSTVLGEYHVVLESSISWDLHYKSGCSSTQGFLPFRYSDSAMLGQVSTTHHDPFFLQNQHHYGDSDLLPSSAASLGYNFGSLKLQLLFKNFEEIFPWRLCPTNAVLLLITADFPVPANQHPLSQQKWPFLLLCILNPKYDPKNPGTLCWPLRLHKPDFYIPF